MDFPKSNLAFFSYVEALCHMSCSVFFVSLLERSIEGGKDQLWGDTELPWQIVHCLFFSSFPDNALNTYQL